MTEGVWTSPWETWVPFQGSHWWWESRQVHAFLWDSVSPTGSVVELHSLQFLWSHAFKFNLFLNMWLIVKHICKILSYPSARIQIIKYWVEIQFSRYKATISVSRHQVGVLSMECCQHPAPQCGLLSMSPSAAKRCSKDSSHSKGPVGRGATQAVSQPQDSVAGGYHV